MLFSIKKTCLKSTNLDLKRNVEPMANTGRLKTVYLEASKIHRHSSSPPAPQLKSGTVWKLVFGHSGNSGRQKISLLHIVQWVKSSSLQVTINSSYCVCWAVHNYVLVKTLSFSFFDYITAVFVWPLW